MSDPAPSVRPLQPVIDAAALGLLAAAIVARCFTNAASLELLDPGAQLLFAALALAALAAAALARALERRALLADEPRLLLAAGGCAGLLVLGAGSAAHQDLAWRTTLEWTSLLGLGLAARDLARDPRLARALLGLMVGAVVVGALLGLHDDLVRYPALRAALEAKDPLLERDLAQFAPDQRIGMEERIKAGGAVGPWLLANLLACAIACVLPLALVGTWLRRQSPLRALPGALACAALLLTLLRTRSKGGVLAALGALLALGLLHPRLAGGPRRRALAGLAGLGAIGLVGVVLLWRCAPEREGLGLSLTVRLEYWAAGLSMWREAPLLGHGPNQFRELYGQHKSARAEEAIHAHNAPVQLLAELGLIGVAALGALAFLLLRPGLRALDAAPAADAAPPPATGPPALTEGALLFGQLLGWGLVAGFGDELGLAEEALAAGLPGWALLLLSALLLAPLAVALRPPLPATPPLVLPALLAGLVGFALDGLTDFGFHYAGTLLLAALLGGLVPAAAGPRPPPPPAPVGGPLLGFTLLVLAFVVLFGLARPALEADQLRTEARVAHLQAKLLADEGRPQEARAALREAAQGLRASLALYPGSAETWRQLGAIEGWLGDLRAAREALERACREDPSAAGTWIELGELLIRGGDPQAGFEALARGIALYPHHPGHLLRAAQARAAALPRLQPAERERRRQEALALLTRAEEASRTTRLVLRRLSPEEQVALTALRTQLEGR